MAHEEINYEIEQVKHDIGLTPITLSLAVLAGVGVTLMIFALAIGVSGGENTGGTVGLLFISGLLAMITGSAAWFGVVRPDTHFDDINKPLDGGHGHATTHAHDEHALVAADDHAVATADHGASHGH
ncbi:MAG TPA: hypothetical protein VHL11_03210 [Phototrophicaceae bacterium]|nr:hypothetical protein [Phototrophicaceae bacterium]